MIALGYKPLSAVPKLDKDALRLEVERDLTFAGLVMLENKLKRETAPTLALLKAARVRTVMITGDNPLTGTCCFVLRVACE